MTGTQSTVWGRANCVGAVGIWLLAARIAAGDPGSILAGLGETGGAEATAGNFRLLVVPQEPLRPLQVLEDGGAVLLFDGRRGVDLLLSGETPEPALPELAPRVRVVTDAGEEIEATLLPGEGHSNGRGFCSRYRLDLSRARLPFRIVRLEGRVCEPLPARTLTHRFPVEFAVAAALQAGPVRVAAAPGEAQSGEEPQRGTKIAGTFVVLCEWNTESTPEPDHSGLVSATGEIAGPVSVELRAADGRPIPLAHTVALDQDGASRGRRRAKFLWDLSSPEPVEATVAEAGEAASGQPLSAELVVSYRFVARRVTPFTIERVVVPDPGPPALARMRAQMMVLNGPLEEPFVVSPPLEEELEGEAPHPLIDRARGSALRFQLRIDGRPPGEGSLQAALAPKQEGGWGGWRWFSGRTDAAGEATLPNIRPGVYRLRVRFRPGAGTSAAGGGTIGLEYRGRDRVVRVPVRSRVDLPVFQLRAGD